MLAQGNALGTKNTKTPALKGPDTVFDRFDGSPSSRAIKACIVTVSRPFRARRICLPSVPIALPWAVMSQALRAKDAKIKCEKHQRENGPIWLGGTSPT
jgi:hypothetical protein